MLYEPNKMIAIKESFTIQPRMLSNISHKNGFRPHVRIIRHLEDDTFDVIVAKDPDEPLEHTSYYPYVNAGDRYATKLSTQADDFRRWPTKYIPDWRMEAYIVHRKAFGEPTFSNLKHLVVGLVGFGRQSLFTVEINKLPTTGLMDVPVGSFGKIDALKQIDLWTTRVSTDPNAGIHEIESFASFKKTSLFYEPIKANRATHTTDVANIYLSSMLENPERDIKNEMYKVTTGNFEKGLAAHNALGLKINAYLQIHDRFFRPEIKYYGTVVIDQPTYYDYEKKKTINGAASESAKGDLIPFSFKGDYEFAVKLPFWESFKDFIFRTNHHFDFPYLDKNEGSVTLSIDKSDKHLIPSMHFTKEAIEDITKEKSNYSLRALKRVSNEKGD